jgi:hypothetical protein
MLKNSLSSQIDVFIDQVILPMEEAKVDFISSNSVAVAVINMIDPDCHSPQLIEFASTMHVKQMVRQRLAMRHDPVEKAEDFVNGVSNDLFGLTLQDRYPVKREGDKSYARKEVMSEIEVEANASRMERAGDSLLEHAKALRGWFASKSA